MVLVDAEGNGAQELVTTPPRTRIQVPCLRTSSAETSAEGAPLCCTNVLAATPIVVKNFDETELLWDDTDLFFSLHISEPAVQDVNLSSFSAHSVRGS